MKAMEKRIMELERRVKPKDMQTLRILVRGKVIAEYKMKRRKTDA